MGVIECVYFVLCAGLAEAKLDRSENGRVYRVWFFTSLTFLMACVML